MRESCQDSPLAQEQAATEHGVGNSHHSVQNTDQNTTQVDAAAAAEKQN